MTAKIRHFLPATVLAIAATAAFAPLSANAAGATVNFAFVGDMPYAGDNTPAKMGAWVNDLNSDPTIQLTAHSGDFKGGNDSCSDAAIDSTFNYFNALAKPFWYTPGDNDWTDCHRNTNGNFDPLGRLSYVRSKYFATPGQTIGQNRLAVNSQKFGPIANNQEFVENTWFNKDCITFGDVHSTTSANGLLVPPIAAGAISSGFVDPLGVGPGQAARNSEVARRTQADLAWIDTIFDAAVANQSDGVFLMMQSEPALLSLQPGGLPNDVVSTNDEFAALRAKIFARSAAFNRPVVIAHGDQHTYVVTHNYGGRPELTRLENYGSTAVSGTTNWVQVQADCGTPYVFKQRIRQVGVAPTADYTKFPDLVTTAVPGGPFSSALLASGIAGTVALVANDRRRGRRKTLR